MIALIASWAPTGMVRVEHSAFLADIAASLVANGIDVKFDATMAMDPYESFLECVAAAQRRQADFFLRLAWNCWGPLGEEGKAVYAAALQAMVSTVPGQMELALVERINTNIGPVDCIVFDTPINGESASCDHDDWTVPLARVKLSTDMARCPMILCRSVADPFTENVVGAKVPASLFDPSTGQIITVSPQYA